ncbi:hypothetical protein LY40_001651 [Prauserella salsuginis]|nr:hypothetical protein [Prauserella salsuginis]
MNSCADDKAGHAMGEMPKRSVSVAGIVVDSDDRVLVIRRRDNGRFRGSRTRRVRQQPHTRARRGAARSGVVTTASRNTGAGAQNTRSRTQDTRTLSAEHAGLSAGHADATCGPRHAGFIARGRRWRG